MERIVELHDVRPYAYLSLCLFGAGVHCDHDTVHTVHLSADLSSQLDS